MRQGEGQMVRFQRRPARRSEQGVPEPETRLSTRPGLSRK